MEFLKFIRSLEELLYEVMTWLLFYPRTLWRVLRHPLRLTSQADAEMDASPEKQFIDLVSPPLFLMLTVLLAHALEIALHQNGFTAKSELARALLASETNLLIFRAISWSFFPLLMASTLLALQKRPVDRETLRRPFFLQCLFTAPFVAGASAATALGRLDFPLLSAAVALAVVAWYLVTQTRWLRDRLGIGTGRALLISVAVSLVAAIVDSVIAAITLGLSTG